MTSGTGEPGRDHDCHGCLGQTAGRLGVHGQPHVHQLQGQWVPPARPVTHLRGRALQLEHSYDGQTIANAFVSPLASGSQKVVQIYNNLYPRRPARRRDRLLHLSQHQLKSLG